MIIWRLDFAKRSQSESFSGQGAMLAGGRWNRKGLAAVYASQNLSLSALEKLVHTQRCARTMSLVAYGIELPRAAQIDEIEPGQLSPGWRAIKPPHETVDLGSRWLAAKKTLVLRVPSAIIPSESNLMLNPAHALFRDIKVFAREAFSFDPRLWK